MFFIIELTSGRLDGWYASRGTAEFVLKQRREKYVKGVFLIAETEETTAPLPMAWNDWDGRDSLKA